MHTRSLDDLSKEILYGIPIPVYFAGLKGDTLSLAKAGWEMSMRQENRYGEYELQLALRAPGGHLHALSSRINLRVAQLYGSLDNPITYAKFLTEQAFVIEHIGSGIEVVTTARTNYGVSWASTFEAVSPWIEERTERINVRDFKFFKPAKPSIKDIIVSPEQVPELLELVLRAQAPAMEEIKARERSRSNAEWARNGYAEVKPAHEVQAQIITLARA